MTGGGVDYSIECVGDLKVLREAFLSTHDVSPKWHFIALFSILFFFFFVCGGVCVLLLKPNVFSNQFARITRPPMLVSGDAS